jgi:hypothetical protein
MNPETLTALKVSIQHWEELSNATSLDDANIGPSSCALCGLFNTPLKKRLGKTCIGCPVYERTGLEGCRNSPYENINRSFLGEDFPNFLIHAKKELVFLKSLLPTDGQ